MRPLGKQQLAQLLALANPGQMQVVGDKLTDALEKRGMVRWYSENKRGEHGFIRITPSGMRALAIAYEDGRLDQFMGKTCRKIVEGKSESA